MRWLLVLLSLTSAVAAPARPMADREALFWESIRDSENPAEYQAYLDQFPDGIFATLAKSRMAALRPIPAEPSPRASNMPLESAGERLQRLYAHISGPSFNCQGSLLPAERLLCSDSELSRVDGVMGEIYGMLRKRLPKQQEKRLRDEQRSWIRQRDRDCPVTARDLVNSQRRAQNIDCLLTVTQQRAVELQALLDTLPQ